MDKAPRAQRTISDTMIITPDDVASWKIPPFQRPVKVNARVREVVEELKQTQVMTGVIHLGTLNSETKYVVDGQHRLEAFKLAGIPEMLVDIRIVHFESMADMAEEYVRLNTALRAPRPDDILRGLEGSTPAIKKIRHDCSFVGYEQV